MFDLTGKGALVTGATGGIGWAIAKSLHAQGANVAISGTKAEKLDTLASELGSRAFTLPCDLRDRAAVAKLGEDAEKALGQVDILVNNAGITHDNLFMRMKDEEWDDVIAVNLTSVFVLTRTILRNMMRRRYGRIVNIASISGVLGNPGQGNYAASKAGLVGMTKSLAREVSSRGITANCIAPGFIKTPMTDALTPKQVEVIAAAIPAQTFGKPEDVAAAVVFLASNEAAYITGETIHVNGGMVMV
ncbi:MAG TPA: 3-oxoacyl-[acyl-carrier-protein] reductase [Methyloceanibacter sp.]|jgi:3-oxoacyl-[acyl-carrier protein] reductase|nr:3-oxoacyl-[acyl-carrier-protein] reductase [Methyloceanibacter sp.]